MPFVSSREKEMVIVGIAGGELSTKPDPRPSSAFETMSGRFDGRPGFFVTFEKSE